MSLPYFDKANLPSSSADKSVNDLGLTFAGLSLLNLQLDLVQSWHHSPGVSGTLKVSQGVSSSATFIESICSLMLLNLLKS